MQPSNSTTSRIAHLERLIIAKTDELFVHQDLRINLHVAVRLACEFNDFIRRFPEQPPEEDLQYLAGTIRSGIDEIFQVAFSARLGKNPPRWNSPWPVTPLYEDIRKQFLAIFQGLDEESDGPDLLAKLLTLGRLELLFLSMALPVTGTE